MALPAFIQRLWPRSQPPSGANAAIAAEMAAVSGWLGSQPSPAELGRALAAVQGVRAVGTSVGRLSQDRPELANFGMSVLQPPDVDLDWRIERLDSSTFDRIQPTRLLELLCDASPDVSRALWDFLRFTDPGFEKRALRPDGKTVDVRAQANLDAFVGTLGRLYGTPDIPIKRLYFSAFLRGAFLGELVLDESGQPVDLATPDPKIVKFRSRVDPVRGSVWEPGQYQGGKWVSLEIPTIRYIPVDPFPGSPYGRSLCAPALFTTLFALALLHDLKRVVQQQGYPRLDISIDMEKIRAWLLPMVGNDQKKLMEAFDSYVAQIKAGYRDLEPDAAFVHGDSIVMNRPQGTVDSSSLGAIDSLVRYLERLAVRALKTMPIYMGINEGGSETWANRQAELHSASVRSLQHACESLLKYLCEIALQSMGTPATVEWRFAELRKSEMMRDAQTDLVRGQVGAYRYFMGWINQDQAAQYAADVEKADAEEPRMVPSGFGGAVAQQANTENPEPGSARSLPDFGRELVNGNGIKEAA